MTGYKDKLINFVLIIGIILGFLCFTLGILFYSMIPSSEQCYVVSCNSEQLTLLLNNLIRVFSNTENYCLEYHLYEYHQCYLINDSISLTNYDQKKNNLLYGSYIAMLVLAPVLCISSCIVTFLIDRTNSIVPIHNTAGSASLNSNESAGV